MNDVVTAEPVSAGTDLAIIQTLTPAIVFREGGVRSILDSIKAEVARAEIDISTPKGRKDCTSLAYKIARSKTALDKMGKDLTDQWRRQAEAVHVERRMIVQELDALADRVRAPLTEWENAEKARIQAHEAAIAAITEGDAYGATETSEEFAMRLAYLQNYPARDWQEFKQRADRALAAEIARTERLLTVAQQREADEDEAARLRAEEDEKRRQAEETERREREARIAAEAAEHARLEAEAKAAEEAAQAERRAQAERDQIEAERVAAEQRERDERERAERAEREKAEAEARAEAARVRTHVDALTAIAEVPEYGERESAAEIGRRLEYLLNHPARDWEEYADRAAEALAVEIARTRELLAAAEEREAQKTEADRLAAVEREEKAAQEAAAAERRRQEQEAARVAEEARKREANIAHRRKTNREAADAIVLAISDVHSGNADEAQAFAQAVVTAIAKRAVPHVTIAY